MSARRMGATLRSTITARRRLKWRAASSATHRPPDTWGVRAAGAGSVCGQWVAHW